MLTGILVDVSGSMKGSLQLNAQLTDEHMTRAESIFTTIIKIAEREVNSNNNQEIFVLAFGLHDVTTCDLLSLLERNKTLNKNVIGYNPLIKLLEENGAPYAGDYVKKHLTKEEAGFLYDFYSKNSSLLREIIDDLPDYCKDGEFKGNFYRGTTKVASFGDSKIGKITLGAAFFVGAGITVVNPLVGMAIMLNTSTAFTASKGISKKEEKVTREYADRAIEKAKSNIRESILNELRAMRQPKKKTLKLTIDLLHTVAGTTSSSRGKTFSAPQLSNLVASIEPHIYGNTPMCEALRSALDMFYNSGHNDKALFLLTDGEATDGNPVKFAQQLRENDVLVFVCLLTSENISHPRRLYYEAEKNWTNAQRNMFELSSTVENTHSAMSILLEQGWELPTAGHSRLFIQANHPDVIDEFTSLARRVIESNDALLNIFGRVTLDQYINSAISTFEPNDQIGGTCYANAVAAVLHLAMKRIEGREGGVPEFRDICNQLIAEYGERGANTENVLRVWSPKYRLQYKTVDELGARKAINARRPVIAIFCLYCEQWTAFSKFYKNNPKGILESKDLDTNGPLTNLGGHAVVLIKCDPKSLTFMNSWGTEFADGGFFKVKDESVLNLKFFDVFWTLNDLKHSEIKAFGEKKRKVGEDFLRKLPSSVQNFLYECPKCQQSSPAIMFIGHLLEATCPKCNQNFKPTPVGLVLNSYTY